MVAIIGTWARLKAVRLGLGLRSQRAEINLSGVIAIVILMIAYYRFPWVFEDFVRYAFSALNNAIKSGGTSPKPGSHTVPVTTTTHRG